MLLDSFEFLEAPFTSLATVIVVIFSYLALLFCLQRVMKAQNPIRLEGLFIAHNALLSIASLILLVFIAPIIASDVADHGLQYSICAKEMAFNNKLNFYYYVNYLMKFWELADTCFLVLRKKPLKFLHVDTLLHSC
jgi:fatty acid elongase 3